jgi:hypothetical protein
MSKGVKNRRWGTEDLTMAAERALEAVQNGGAGLIAASHEYSAPKAALTKHLDVKNHFVVANTQVVGSKGGIPPHVRQELINHILQLEERMFGKTIANLW